MGNGKSSNDCADSVGGGQYTGQIKGQNYADLKRSCLKSGTLFVDDLFVPKELNISAKNIKWVRASELVRNPKFMPDDLSVCDIEQGRLSDCWFISAMAVLTLKPALLKKVVPQQSFQDGYAGIFNFNFYCDGEWINVVVDDILPSIKGQLVLAHSDMRNVFWISLLEKAYAKMKGDYDVLNYGFASEAMVDLTGGIPEIFRFRTNNPDNFFSTLYRAFNRNSLICCTIDIPGQLKVTLLDNGLYSLHCYSITGVLTIGYKGFSVNLVKVKNPWGTPTKWNGAWSPNSVELESFTDAQKLTLCLTPLIDGEFWMSYEDFIQYFNVFDFCHLSLPDVTNECGWYSLELHGEWVKGISAGGCINYFKDTFLTNPIILFTLINTDPEDDDNMSTVIISLSQKSFRLRKIQSNDDIKIGFVVYRIGDLDEQSKKLRTSSIKKMKPEEVNKEFFRVNPAFAKVEYICKRDVTCRYRFSHGLYYIIPTTFSKEQESLFMLRIFISTGDVDKNMLRL